MDAFRQDLKEDLAQCWARTSECDCRWADGAYDRLPSLTNDLLSLRVNVMRPVRNLKPYALQRLYTPQVPPQKSPRSCLQPIIFRLPMGL